MIGTIDSAGRLVIPKTYREQFNLAAVRRRAGARAQTGHPHPPRSSRSDLDIGEFVRAERDARHTRIASDAD